MDLENKRLYTWMPWVVTLLITGLFVLLLVNELARQEHDSQQRLLLEQAANQATFEVTQGDLLHHAELFAQLIARDSTIINLIREAALINERDKGDPEKSAAIRAKLQEALQHYWLQMTPLGFRELNVHFNSSHGAVKAIVFLRQSNPDRFGDEITQLSPLVVDTFTSGIPASGMEVRHYGANYRAFAPVKINSGSDTKTLAVLEVGMGLLPSNNPGGNQGEAVLISSTLAREILWGRAQQDAIASAKGLNSPWYVETHNNPLVKDWLASGVLSNLQLDKRVPWVIHHQDRYYLLASARFAGLGTSHAPAVASRVLALTWSDITEEQLMNEEARKTLCFHYLLGWLFSLVILWVLFRLNRRHVLQLIHEHSQQIQGERDLSEQARQRLTLALVSSESGFWEWNITTNRAFFSKEWRDLCGLPHDSEDGTADIEEWLMRVHPSDKRASYTEMIRHIKGETAMFENEYRLKIADGSYKWIFTRGKVVEWLPDGKAALMLGVYTDITERKKNEIIVVRQQAALRALNEIASIPVFDAEEQLSRALEIGARYLGLPCGTVSRVVGNQYQLKIVYGHKCPRDKEGPLSNYFCEFTLRNQDVFSCDEISKSEYSTHYAIKHIQVDTYIGVPIWLQGKIYGTLSFDSEYSRHQIYDDLDKDFMRLLARWVSVTLERWQYQSEQHLLLDRFEKLCNHLPGFLYQYQLGADDKSFFPFASSGIEAIYGITPEAVKEDASYVFRTLHPDDLGWVSESISTSAATLKNWKATYRVLHPRRGEIWVRGEARPERLHNGDTLWHGYMQDVTEEKLAAIKLQDINALREAIFDAASLAIISTNEHGIVKTFNQGAERLLGYSAGEVIDTVTPLLFHLKEEVATRADFLTRELGKEVKPGFDVFTSKVREGNEDENEWTYVRKDGTHVPIILSATTLRSADGNITGYLGLARDISEIKRINRMKNEFISTVSHELRTPLTAISGALGIVVGGAAGNIPDTAGKMLNIAHKNSLRLIHLVNDLLDMEKLSAGKMNFDLKPLSILNAVTQSIDANAAYAAQYQVKLVLNNCMREDLRVNIDAQRMQQVLANFISNAAKFSPAGEGVEICIEKNYNSVRVSVIDKGPGIPEEFRSRIFQKFSQADSSDSRQKGGTGLGLAICKEIIERMGGRVGFISEPGNGSQFFFELPSEEGSVTQGQSNRHATGERLLVVEDDPEVAELFATMLREKNYRVDIAYSGQDALERLALYAYKALTMDIQLPDMNGLELIQQLRSDASTKHLPVIVISANLDSERMANRKAAIFAGVQWLQKPQTTASIITAVKTALAHQAS